MRVVTFRLLKPPPWGVVIGALRKTLGAPQRLPGRRVDAGGVAGEVDLLADLDLLDVEARAGLLQDVERRGHDLGADAVAAGDGDGNWVRHERFRLRFSALRSGRRASANLSSRSMARDDAIALLAGRIGRAARLTVVTGAGVSAASGIPTFRGPGGLWRQFRPEELATPEAFARDPKLVWEWYAWRRELVARARPNRAHEVLAAWSRRFPTFRLVTQNVDGLHERAGTENVIRFHGSLWEVSCWERCAASPRRWPDETVSFPELPPRCPHCGGLVRPGVVWFGEPIDPDVLAAADAALDCDVCLAVGHLGPRLSGRRARDGGRRAGSVHGRDQPRGDAGVRGPGPRRCGQSRGRARRGREAAGCRLRGPSRAGTLQMGPSGARNRV